MSATQPRDSLERAAARADILDRIDALHPGLAPLWGRMTVHQMVCHLADTFRMALGDRPVRDRSRPLVRAVARWYALHTPARMPKRVPTLRELDQERGGTPPAAFAADIERLKGLIHRFVDAGDALEGRPHAFLGPLTAWEWGRWGYRHTDHHLRQFGLTAPRRAGGGRVRHRGDVTAAARRS